MPVQHATTEDDYVDVKIDAVALADDAYTPIGPAILEVTGSWEEFNGVVVGIAPQRQGYGRYETVEFTPDAAREFAAALHDAVAVDGPEELSIMFDVVDFDDDPCKVEIATGLDLPGPYIGFMFGDRPNAMIVVDPADVGDVIDALIAAADMLTRHANP